jgi:hypothetical protein
MTTKDSDDHERLDCQGAHRCARSYVRTSAEILAARVYLGSCKLVRIAE